MSTSERPEVGLREFLMLDSSRRLMAQAYLIDRDDYHGQDLTRHAQAMAAAVRAVLAEHPAAEAAPTADERCDIARHARPHATWGDDPSGSCGCAGCDGCPCATPDAEAAPVCDDDACPGVGRACPYPAAGCGANDPEDAPTAGERACAACGVCPYARPATPDASGGLSVDERVELTDLVWPVNYADPDLDAICELVERIVAARVAAAETRARREHGEKIAQAIEAEQGRWDARFPTPEGWDLEYILRRAGTYSGLGKAAHIARSLSPDAAEGDGRGEG